MNPDPPSVTTTVADTLVFAIVSAKTQTTYTQPTNYTERWDRPNTSAGTPSNAGFGRALASTGAEDPGAPTANGSQSEWVATTVAINPTPPAIDISGTCIQNDQSTNCTDTGTIKVAVNGVLMAQTQPTVSGSWTISGVPVSLNAIVTVFIDGVVSSEDRAVAVTQYDNSGNITGIALIEGRLSIGSDDYPSDDGPFITMAELESYDNSASGDADIPYESSAGNLTVDNNGSWSGKSSTSRGATPFTRARPAHAL
jgi:hypothetical protein